jgi:hypothetical protein
MEVFETEFLDTDDDDSEDSQSDMEDESAIDISVIEEKKEKILKKKADRDAQLAKEAEIQKPDYGDLVKGVDFIDEEISTSKAFTVFRQLEEEDTARPFKPPEFERGGMSTSFSRLD